MNTRKRNRLRAWLLLPFIILISVFVLFTGGGISWIYFNKDKVGNVIVNELNKSLKSEITVENIDMVFISTFPFISLEFENVLGKEVLPPHKNPDTLFHAGFVYLKFNLIDIYKRQYSIKQIRIEDASFRMKIYKDGSNNYIFWKTTEEGSNISLDLKKIDILNSRFTFRNYATKQFYDININKSVSSGEFSSGLAQIKTQNDLLINIIQFEQVAFAKNVPTKLSMTFEHDADKKEIRISDNKLLLKNLSFIVHGSYNYSAEQFIDMSIKSKNINIKELISLLPEQYKKSLKSFKSNGVIDINGAVKGKIGKLTNPYISVDFSIRDGNLEDQKKSIQIHKINLSGNFSNGDKQNASTSKLVINNLSTNLNDGFLKGNLSVTNFNTPSVKGNIDADFDLYILENLLSLENLERIKGRLKTNLEITGKIDDLSKGQAYALEKCKFKGEAFISNGSIKLRELKNEINDLNTNIIFSNNNIEVNYLTSKIGNTDISFTGQIGNLPGYLFNNDNLSLSGDAIINYLNLQEFFGSSDSNNSSSLNLPKRISTNINVTVSNFEYKTLKSKNIKSKFILTTNQLLLNDIYISVWGGKLSGNIQVSETNDFLKIGGNANIRQIEIGNILSTFNNFEQNLFTSDNLKGKVSSDINFIFNYSSPDGIDPNSLKTTVDLTLENGELINIDPLMKLSSFLDEDALKHIKFKTLTNKFSIQNKTLFVPMMQVSSNAVNFTLHGKHSFNNDIDYHIRLHLSELASKRQKERLRKEQEAFGSFEEDLSGKIAIYLAITGTLENPKFKYDFPSAKQKVKEDIKKEKEEIKQTLKEEFISEEQQEAKENWKIQEQGNYIIEWEEDSIKNTSKPKKKKETQFTIEWDE